MRTQRLQQKLTVTIRILEDGVSLLDASGEGCRLTRIGIAPGQASSIADYLSSCGPQVSYQLPQ